MPDQVTVRLQLGTWMMQSAALRPLGEVAIFPALDSPEDFTRQVISALRDADFNPWEHQLVVSAYYANASIEAWDLVVSVAPLIKEMTSAEALRLLAGALLGAIFAKFLPLPDWFKQVADKMSLAKASDQVREYVVSHHNVAPGQVQELSARQLDDGSYEIIVRRDVDDHTLLFRIAGSGGISGWLDMNELEGFLRTEGSPGEESV
jgi:hypothetical protein